MLEITETGWKDIPGLEGSYQAHPSGKIRSLKRTGSPNKTSVRHRDDNLLNNKVSNLKLIER